MKYLKWILGGVFLIALGFLLGGSKRILPSLRTSPEAPSPSGSISQTISAPSTTPITGFKVPILMYHHIRNFNDSKDKIGTKLSVSPENFERQMKWLKENGYQSVTPSYLLKPYPLPHKPIILTFDDGYEDAYTTALPILKKYGFTATFYLITNYVSNNERYLTWEQIKTMQEAGMNFGSHTLSHPDLEKSTLNRARKEIFESKKIIEEHLGEPVTDFCYPSGKYNDQVVSLVKEAGYKTATTVSRGIARENSDYFKLPRLRVENQTNLEILMRSY